MFAQQLQALNIHMDEENVAEEGEVIKRQNATKNVEAMSTIQTDAEAIVQALEVISS